MISTNIHQVTNVKIEDGYLPTSETHYSTVTVTTENGERATFTLFSNGTEKAEFTYVNEGDE